jgi:four helix bundle protein
MPVSWYPDRMTENLKVFQKWLDMAKYLYRAIQSYPRSEKYTLGGDTRQAMIRLGRYIYRANALHSESYEKRRMLEQADLELVDLQLLIRLAKELEFLPLKKYELMSGMAVEIGRMLGGWIKATSKIQQGRQSLSP